MMRDVSVKIGGYTIETVVEDRRRCTYAIWDKTRKLVAVTVYKRGAVEVAQRLERASALLAGLKLAEATIRRLNRHDSANGTLDVIRAAIDKAEKERE